MKGDPRTCDNVIRSEPRLASEHQKPLHKDVFRTGATTVTPLQKCLTRAKVKKLMPSGPKFFFQIKLNVTVHSEITVKSGEAQTPRCSKSSLVFSILGYM